MRENVTNNVAKMQNVNSRISPAQPAAALRVEGAIID
jgi:hypothetical protein